MEGTKRNQTFRFNCSESEKLQIKQIIKDSGLKKNEFIIASLLNNYKTKLMNAAIFACGISDQINQIESEYPNIDFMPVRKELHLLCQHLSQ